MEEINIQRGTYMYRRIDELKIFNLTPQDIEAYSLRYNVWRIIHNLNFSQIEVNAN